MTLLSFQKTAKYPHLKSETEKGVMDLSPAVFARNSLLLREFQLRVEIWKISLWDDSKGQKEMQKSPHE